MAKSKTRNALFARLSAVCPSATPDDMPVKYLSDFFAVINWFLRDGQEGWFRGQPDAKWTLAPSALRHRAAQKRALALNLLDEFRRCVEPRVGEIKARTDDEVRLHWLQLARNTIWYADANAWTGPQTPLLACISPVAITQKTAHFFILDPINLNSTSDHAQRC